MAQPELFLSKHVLKNAFIHNKLNDE